MNDWDDLRFFLAVARVGNVTGAAKLLGVNHSTVSRRIQSMEEKHGVRLFERLSHGYETTPAAAAILELAEDIEQKNQEVDRLLFGQDQRLQGQLNVTMPHDLANFCVIPKLNAFVEQFPEVELRLIVSPGLKNLNAREADIAIRLTPNPPDYLIGKKVANLRHGIYRSKSYVPNSSGEDTVILWNHEKEIPQWVVDHFPNAHINLRVDDLASIYAAIKSGIGIARIPCYLPDTLQEPDIVRMDLPLQASKWGVWILSHVELKETARVKACKEYLSDILSEQKDIFEGRRSLFS